MMGAMKDFDRRIRQGGDDAARAALEYALTVAARWIPVEERLPTAGEEVLSFSENYGHVVARLDGGKWYAIHTDTETGEPWIREEVTHWMPLPEPPAA